MLTPIGRVGVFTSVRWHRAHWAANVVCFADPYSRNNPWVVSGRNRNSSPPSTVPGRLRK